MSLVSEEELHMFVWVLICLGCICMIAALIWGIVIQGRSITPKIGIMIGDICMILLCVALMTATILYQKKNLSSELEDHNVAESSADGIQEQTGDSHKYVPFDEIENRSYDNNPFMNSSDTEEFSGNDEIETDNTENK